jgi:hypothetical protein
MKIAMIAAVAGFAGLAAANPFLHQAGGVQGANLGEYSTRGGAQITVVSVNGIASYDGFGAAINDRLSVMLSSNATVIGVGWDVNLETVGASWLSEATVTFLNSPIGLQLSPGDVNAPGNQFFSSGGILDLASIDPTFPFQVGVDGMLNMEFWDSFVDNPGAVDAFWSGSLTIQWVPTPGAVAVLGMGGLIATRRRR